MDAPAELRRAYYMRLMHAAEVMHTAAALALREMGLQSATIQELHQQNADKLARLADIVRYDGTPDEVLELIAGPRRCPTAFCPHIKATPGCDGRM